MPLRLSPAAYRRVVLVALVLLATIIVTGGAVRVTGSGLGCPDWPQCNGTQLVAPRSFHPLVEFVNRLFTGAVSVAVIVAVLGSLVRSPRRRDLTVLSLGLVAGVVGQIVLGGLTVLFHLWPPLVMAHFLLSMAIVLDAVVLHHRAGRPDPPPGTDRPPPLRPVVDKPLLTLGRVLVGLAAAVLAVGTAVTGAGPHGGDEHVRRLPLVLPDVARVHGVLVEVFTAVLLVTLVLLWRSPAPAGVLRRAQVVLAVTVAQSVLGYVQYFSGVPSLLVAFHIGLAVSLWVAVLRLHLGLWSPLAPSEAEPDHAARTASEPALVTH